MLYFTYAIWLRHKDLSIVSFLVIPTLVGIIGITPPIIASEIHNTIKNIADILHYEQILLLLIILRTYKEFRDTPKYQKIQKIRKNYSRSNIENENWKKHYSKIYW